MTARFSVLHPDSSEPRPSWARIYPVLRERIISAAVAPGASLSEKDIAENFGVSRTPVREALLRLADERLVDIFPQRGTFVSRIPLDSVRDAMVIRQALERVAVREAAMRAIPSELAELRLGLQRQRDHDRNANLVGFHAEDEAFHHALAQIAGHPNLWRVIRREKAQVDRCRVLSLPLGERRKLAIQQHLKIADAVGAGDPDAAERAMEIHLASVFPAIDELQAAFPDYFELGSVFRPQPKRNLAK